MVSGEDINKEATEFAKSLLKDRDERENFISRG